MGEVIIEYQELIKKGIDLSFKNKFKEALYAFDRALDINPKGFEAWLGKAGIYVEERNFQDAINSYDELIKLGPDFEIAWRGKSAVLYEIRKYDEALICAEKALSLDPSNEKVLKLKNKILNEINKPREPREDTIPENEISNDSCYLNDKGVDYARLGKLEDALIFYDKAIKLDSRNFRAWSNKASALEKLGKFNEAISACDKSIKINPKFEEAWLNKGSSLLSLGKFDESQICFDEVLKIKTDSIPALHNKGISLAARGRYKEAIDYFDKVLALDPKQWNTQEAKKKALSVLNKKEDKVPEKQYDQNLISLMKQGIENAVRGRYQEALKLLDKVISINPDFSGGWSNKGWVLSKMRKSKEALKYLNKSLELDPNNVNNIVNKGSTLNDLGKFKEALKTYDEAIDINPNYESAWYGKGNTLLDLRDFIGAIYCYNQALKINPHHTNAHFNRNLAIKGLKGLEQKVKDKAFTENKIYCINCLELKKKILMKYKNMNVPGKGIRYYYDCPECGHKEWTTRIEDPPDLLTFYIGDDPEKTAIDISTALYKKFVEKTRRESSFFRSPPQGKNLPRDRELISQTGLTSKSNKHNIERQKAEELYLLGVNLARSGKYKKALKYYNKSIKITPINLKVWKAKILALQALGRYAEVMIIKKSMAELFRKLNK